MHNTRLFLSIFFCFFLLNSGITQESHSLEKVIVKGNKFVSESGETMLFQGVNIRDPHQLEKNEKWTKAHFKMAKSWGANMIRLPIHPAAWRERGKKDYLKILDEAVEWARELELYLVIDWHSIGNLHAEKFQNPMYNTTVEETYEFWNIISKHFSEEPVIAMYELFNEPTVGGPRFGNLNWSTWKEMNEDMIKIIRKNDEKTVVLVAGFNWAYDLTPVKNDPIEMSNIAYVSHPYPEKRKQPWEAQWQKDWGFVSEKYPVILTEIGFALPEERGVHVPVHGDETYGNALVDFCDERGISWLAWCFDNRWSPLMYTGDYIPTRQGAFFKEAMQKR